jgi:hypothetical protein
MYLFPLLGTLHATQYTGSLISGALLHPTGTVQQAVISITCGMSACTSPLFFLSRATHHVVVPLAISVPLFKVTSAAGKPC